MYGLLCFNMWFSLCLGIHEFKKTHPRQINVRNTQSLDPIPPVAKDIASEAWLLCFDEFQVKA